MEAWEDEFAVEEMKNLQINPQAWKDMYIFLDFHEIYFVEFPMLVFQWLEKKAKIRSRIIPLYSISWTKDRLNLLNDVNNCWSREVDFRYTSVVEGYTMDFMVEGSNSFSEVERKKIQRPRGKFINYVPLWIKMLLYDKGIMSIENNTMIS